LVSFEAIDWSTSRVYRQTLARAEQLGLRVRSVPDWYDVDEPADLERLQRDLATSADSVAPNTRAALHRLADRFYPDAVGSGGTSSVGVRPDIVDVSAVVVGVLTDQVTRPGAAARTTDEDTCQLAV